MKKVFDVQNINFLNKIGVGLFATMHDFARKKHQLEVPGLNRCHVAMLVLRAGNRVGTD